MPNWKKVIVSGSDAFLNSLTVTNGITGSLYGTSSWAENAVTAFNTPNAVITASNVGNDDTIEFLKGGGGTFAVTVNNVQDAVSSSYALTASYVNPLVQNVIITGSVDVLNGNVNITSNSNFFQGSSVGGNNVSLIGVNNQDEISIGNLGYTNVLEDDTIVSGSLTVTSSLSVQGSTTLSGSITTKTYRLTSSSYTASLTDYRIGVRYTQTGSVSIQLPLITDAGEIEYKFKDEEGNSKRNNITIIASGSDLIDGDINAIMNRNYMAIGIYNDGVSNWYIE